MTPPNPRSFHPTYKIDEEHDRLHVTPGASQKLYVLTALCAAYIQGANISTINGATMFSLSKLADDIIFSTSHD